LKEDVFFDVELNGLKSSNDTWTTSCAHHKNLTMAVPVEFDGTGGGVSPEDLFAMSLINCFAATFKVISKNSKLEFADLHVKGRLYPGRNEKGMWVMKKIDIDATISQPSDSEKAKRLLEKASGLCMIINSTTLEKNFTYQVI